MSYKNSLKELQDERKSNAILTASQMFLENSIEDIAMTDIAKECDIGVASLYRYFGNKTNLVIKCGELLWHDIEALFEGVFENDYYNSKTGIEQINDLMKIFLVLFNAHKPFLKFMHDFDIFVLKEKVTKEDLFEYEKSILNFLPLFEKAYRKGVEDNTVKPDVDYKLLYFSVSHALICMGQKFILGDILISDTQIGYEKQLKQILDNAVYYIKK